MNAKNLIAALAVFAAAGSAFADVTGNFDDYTNIPSTKTRAEVVAELKQAQAQGQLANSEWVESTKFAAKSSHTRDEVRAEAMQYAKTHKKVNPEYDFGG